MQGHGASGRSPTCSKEVCAIMAKEKELTLESLGIGDVIPNWAGTTVRTDATDSAAEEETSIDTHIDMFTEKAWLIHGIEIDLSGAYTALATLVGGLTPIFNAISVYFGKSNLTGATILTPGILGTVKRVLMHHFDTDGEYALNVDPMAYWYPPGGVMPYASSKLAFYASISPDAAGIRNVAMRTRVAFTTVKTTAKLWRELAERWHLLA